MIEWYNDEPKFLATVEVKGRPIKLRTTPESDAFLSSLIELTDAEEILSASVWVVQKANQCVSCPEALGVPPQAITVGGKKIAPFSTPAGERFFEGLKAVPDEDRRIAIASYLHELANQLYHNALNLDPSILPRE